MFKNADLMIFTHWQVIYAWRTQVHFFYSEVEVDEFTSEEFNEIHEYIATLQHVNFNLLTLNWTNNSNFDK